MEIEKDIKLEFKDIDYGRGCYTRIFKNHPCLEWVSIQNYRDITYCPNGVLSTKVSYSVNGRIHSKIYSGFYSLDMISMTIIAKYSNCDGNKRNFIQKMFDLIFK